MLLVISLVVSICASVQPFLFAQESRYYYDFCRNGDQSTMHSFFCEPYFEYFSKTWKPFPTANECEGCETVLTELKKEGDVNRVVENLIETISIRFCESLEAGVREQCKLWTKTHSSNINKMAKKLIDGGTLCKDIFDCKPKNEPSSYLYKLEAKKNEKSFPICDTCINGVNSIEKNILKGLTFDQIVNTMNSLICMNLPTRFYPSCIFNAQNMAEKIMNIANKFQNATKLCNDLKLCKQTPEKNLYYSFFFEETPSTKICDVCNNITTSQFEDMAQTVTEEHWKQLANSLLCDSPTTATMCTSFVDMAIGPLVKNIRQLLTKNSVCHDILHCPSENTFDYFNHEFQRFFERVEKKTTNSSCYLCEIISTILFKTLEDEYSIDLLEFIFTSDVCSEPTRDTKTCIETMKREMPIIIKDITKYLRNLTMCTNACPAPKRLLWPSFLFRSHRSCKYCHRVIRNLKKNITFLFKDEKWVEIHIRTVCKNVPIYERYECNKLISSHRFDIKRMLMKNSKVETICHKINQCSKQTF